MTGERTFEPLEACAAIRLPRGMLQTWSARGWLRKFDTASVRAGQTYPGFPRWIGFRVTFGRCLSKQFRDLHSRRRVRFAFTRYTHRD
jgi:hypothetical protein